MQKKLVLVPLMALSSVAFANDLRSLTHFQKANEFEYATSVDFSSNDEMITYNISSTLLKLGFEESSTQWKNTFAYGLTDQFNFGLGLNYFLSNDRTQKSKSVGSTIYTGTATPGTNTFGNADIENKGLGDIALNANYRLMSGDLNIDLLSTINLSLGDAERGTNLVNFDESKYVNSKGNAKSGGHSFEINTKISGTSNSLEYAANAGFTYNLKKEITAIQYGENAADTANTDVKSTIKSKLDFNLSAETQYLISESFAMGANFGLDFIGKETTTTDRYYDGGSYYDQTETVKARTDMTFGLNTKFNLSKTMLIGAQFSHTFAADKKITSVESEDGTLSTYAGQADDLDKTTFGLNFSVLF